MLTSARWRSVASAVGAVLSAPPDQWSRILSDALDGDASQIRQARALLRHHSADSSFLEHPAQPAPALPQLSSGVILASRYRIESFLGAGAMGEVYEAFDQELRQNVALKVVNPTYSPDASSRERFKRELRLGRQVRNAAVCQLYDVMTADAPDGGSLLVLTMELLRGETLDAVVARGPLREPEARRICEHLLAGLGAAHAEGILHGDLKCANVILKNDPDGPAPLPVITDFGLARRLGPSPADSLRLDEGVIMGTPAYMAPEQMLGKVLSETADIHALGVVLFRMVTGRFPFEGRTAQEVMAQRLGGDAPRARSIERSITESLDRTIAACLAKDPSDRPKDVDAVRALLDRAAPSKITRAAVAVAVVALAGLAAVFGWQALAGRERQLDPAAAVHLKLGEEFLARRGNGDFDQAIEEFRQVAELSPSRPEGWIGLAEAYSGAANWGAIDTADGLRQARDAINRAVAVAPDDARVQSLLGYIASIDVERWLTAEPYFTRALQLDANDEKAQFWYATHLGRLGRQDEAIALLTRVLSASPQSFSVQHQLAMEYFRAGRNAEFLAHASQLARIQPNLPNSRLTLARAYLQNGRVADAAEECRQAEKFGADRSQLLAVLSVVELERGNADTARRMRVEMEEIWKTRPTNSNGLSAAFAMAGDAETAVKYLDAGFQRGDSLVLAAHVTPWFDRIKNDPRFVAFVRRTGLTPSS